MVVPHAFYRDFPLPGHPWIAELGADNPHLAFDYGAASLALVFVLVAAALLLELRLVQVALLAWMMWAVPHLVYHAATFDRLPTVDSTINLITLASVVALPLMLLASTTRSQQR